MTHRFLAVDVPILIAAEPSAEWLTSTTPGVLVKTAERTVNGVRRYYYAGAGAYRILLVMRTGQSLDAVADGAVFRALVGWDAGRSEFVLPEHARKQHTKITVDEVLPADAPEATQAESLLAVMAGAPPFASAGGAREGSGRKPVGGDQRAVSGSITLLPEQWEIIEQLGQNNRSAGVRRLVEEWQRNGGGHEAA